MYFAAKKALLARLTGQTRKDIDRALKHQGGFRAGMVNPSTRQIAVGSLAVEAKKLRVPVYPFNLVGSSLDVWPAIGVYVRQMRPRQNNFQRKDPICTPVEGSEKTVDLGRGRTKTGYTLVRTRPQPIPQTYRFEIRVDSRYEEEVMMISEEITERLDMKGFLEVMLLDGSTISVDTELLEPVLIPSPGGTVETHQQEWSNLHTYLVEGYIDNTLNTTMHPTITRRKLQIDNSFGEPPDEITASTTTDYDDAQDAEELTFI